MQVESHSIPTASMITPTSRDGPNNKLQWKQVFLSQDWASIFVNIFIVIALIVTSQINDAADRSFVTYDATISNVYNATSTIPFWLAIVLPLVCMVISLVVYEYVFYKRQSHFISLTSVVATGFHFFIDFCFAAVVTALLTEVSKLLVGRYRPDWLSRCQPATNSTQPFVPVYGLPPSLNPSCLSDLPEEKLIDGHKSFPSGHSSNAFAMGVYITGYVMYSTYFRAGRKYFHSRKDEKWQRRVASDMGVALSFLWILFNLSWAWGVAISRIIDNKHHPSDVIGGALLGIIIGGTFVLRAVPRHFVVILEEEDEQQRRYQQEPLLYGNNTGRVEARTLNTVANV